jgi:tRNA threonylcarbamoyladenosine biosynthesis protein TsaB
MLSLLIETSTELGLVAIVKEGQVLFVSQLPAGQQNSKYLLPEIQSGLKSLELKVNAFDFIAVGVGPGSYTGIRIGVMTAKTLAFATDTPLIGLCTLQTFLPENEGRFAVMIDAKISGAYVILGQKRGGEVAYLSEPQGVGLNHLPGLLQGIKTVVSPNISRIKPNLEAIAPNLQLEWEVKGPDPLLMYRGAVVKFESHEFTTEGELDILYLRKTQAELEREIKKNPPPLTS